MLGSCVALVDSAITAVTDDRLGAAEQILSDAVVRCPTHPRVGREFAALRFRQARYVEAESLAVGYLALVPGDSLAWQLLATARYLNGDRDGALNAWNRVGLPHVQEVTLAGAPEHRRTGIVRVVAIPEPGVLTDAQLVLARRRLNDLPSVERASVTYQATAADSVVVRATIAERPLLGSWWRVAARTTARAIGSQTVELELTNAAGWGERWQAEWRWEPARPRRALQWEMPVATGVVALELGWERLRVAVDTAGAGVVEDSWHEVLARFGWWRSSNLRPAFAVGLESWNDERRYVALSTQTELRLARDRGRLLLAATQALAVADHPSYQLAALRSIWVSSPMLQRTSWSARLGADWSSATAPIGTWPLLNGGLDRAVPLRAEPDIAGSTMAARATGRLIVHGGLSADQPLADAGPLTIGVGMFVDAARVDLSAQAGVGSRNYLDGGAGVRVGLGRGALGVVRLDLAWGLLRNDRRFGVSVGYHKEWPPWSRTSR